MAGPESRLQTRTLAWVKKTYKPEQIVARKFQAGKYGQNGWPDYDFFRLPGVVFFIEFKAPDGRLTALQEERINRLRAMGFRVYVTDNDDEARACIRFEMGMDP